MVEEEIIVNFFIIISTVAALAPVHELFHALGAWVAKIPVDKISYDRVFYKPPISKYSTLQRFIAGMAPVLMLFLVPVERHFGAPAAVVAATVYVAIPSGQDIRFVFKSRNVRHEHIWEIIRAALTIAYIL